MEVPELSLLVERANNIVSTAVSKETLSTLTHRIVRQEIEKQFSLAKGALDAPEYRKPLKSAITEAVEEARCKKKNACLSSVAEPHSVDEEKTVKKKPPRKLRDEGRASTSKEDGSRSSKSADYVSSDTESEDDGSKTASKPAAALKKRVLLSDEESGDDGHSSGELVTVEKKLATLDRGSREASKPSRKTTTRTKATLSSDDNGGNSNTNVEQRKADEKSDTEISDLIDGPPVKKVSKSHTKPISRETTRARGKKKPVDVASKDEETIKRLKSLVAACGVRKVWAKVFDDLQKPSQQIRKLKEILSELGMRGRFSMEQAKTIRQKRELAQELEDVQTFERAVVGKGGKKRSAIKGDSVEDGDEGEDEEPTFKRRKGNARQSIMAFLQDQSESE